MNLYLFIIISVAVISVILLVNSWSSEPDEFWTIPGAMKATRGILHGNDQKSFANGYNVTSKKKSGLDSVEIGLARARDKIRKAALYNSSCTPQNHCVYLNQNSFRRSYKEMKKKMKVYVYKEGEPPLVHDAPITGIYSTEGLFINQLDNYKSRKGRTFVTQDPEEATVYFLPFSVTMMVKHGFKPNNRPTMNAVKDFVGDYVNVISRNHPFFNRSKGSDHFMLSCHDWAPYSSRSNDFLFRNSIRVLCNANVSEGFVPEKDASLPEMKLLRTEQRRVLGGRPASNRDVLAFFAGGNHGPVRPILFEHWLERDPDVQVYMYLSESQNYSDFMRRARFCLCPSGYEVASPRIVEAIYSGCIPVVISWGYVLPFSDVLNWNSFSLSVSPEEIPQLKKILESVSQDRYFHLQSAVLRVQKHFVTNDPPDRFDMFHMILHSIWLRRLNTRVESPSPVNSSSSTFH